jgi:sarcosine oxidase, subunit gamma
VAERDDMPGWTRPGHYGAAESGVILSEATIVAAWNVQGQPTRASFVDAVARLFGVVLPLAPNTIARVDALSAVWLGPRSWLLVAGGDSPLAEYAAKRDAVNEVGGALFDVSASRLAWRLSGPRAENVLANGCPLDFHPSAFATGSCAQSLLGHVGTLFVKHDDAPTFTILLARSFAHDAWHALLMSAARHGTEIQSPTPYR